MEQFSKEACKGYLIITMQQCAYADNYIVEMLEELDCILENNTIEKAEDVYNKW